MPNKSENPYSALKGIFHEPNRLAIISALSSAPDGLTFKSLKDQCDLTDGNLSRHLKALEDANVVLIDKRFIGAKPQTKAMLTDEGRESFVEYLKVLEEVLKMAAEAVVTGDPDVQLPFARIKTA
ncbi:MAG: transcriptional regulator [Calditrichaeota bacterium]|nr:transcriptional regulator [Calditrichota bacterium]MCB0267165.1 transcriptional regulator [Calditrichota bacterium]MCB0287135.1 transcriptional regulator [Calditrichota bacterium]MCB0299699.1 transcriptional regulator [Calditrichota bacterium]MCB9066468.1 transcriptional regulator [Calditrichia bacterium]